MIGQVRMQPCFDLVWQIENIEKWVGTRQCDMWTASVVSVDWVVFIIILQSSNVVIHFNDAL